MTGVFLSPHDDDESLFAAYTCLRHQPLVITCLRSYIEESWPAGPTWREREPESEAACRILGCLHEHWAYRDDLPDWEALHDDLVDLRPQFDMAWAPLPEPGGHSHHNRIGEIARDVFKNVQFYSTYTHANGKTTTGILVEPEPGWEQTKRQAMACYRSQAAHPNTQAAFNEWPIDEYLSEG